MAGIRTVTFLAELNDLELWGTDIGNAYLESYTEEKVVFIAGPEFGEKCGHLLMIIKAQYGIKSSGRQWHNRLHDVLQELGWKPTRAEEDIWIKDCGDHYEYIAVYVDDLLIAAKEPQILIDQLLGKPYNFKLKGTGRVTYHLGCDFFRDAHGVLCMAPRAHLERMNATFIQMFGEKPPTRIRSPLEPNDHPELDDSGLLDEEGIRKYQSLIGTFQ